MRDKDFREIIPSPSPLPASLGSARMETTTEETGLVSSKLLLLDGFPNCVPFRVVVPLSGTVSGNSILLFFILPCCADAEGRSSEALATEVDLIIEVAGMMLLEDVGEISNWNTSVHMPELNIGPVVTFSSEGT